MQGEFDFHAASPQSGFEQWREQRRAAERSLARVLGLPLGHPCEVWLKNGVRLRGVLRLAGDPLILDGETHQTVELIVDRVRFFYHEIEACLREDHAHPLSPI